MHAVESYTALTTAGLRGPLPQRRVNVKSLTLERDRISKLLVFQGQAELIGIEQLNYTAP